MINITKEQYEALDNIYTGMFNIRVKRPGLCTQLPDVLTKEDKVYIFPNSKIKRLDLRKWLKSKDIKQVFKPEDATSIVVNDQLMGHWGAIKPKRLFSIPPGKYYHHGSTEHLAREVVDEMIVTEYHLKGFIVDTMYYNTSWTRYTIRMFPESNFEEVFESFKCVYKAVVKNYITLEHIESLVNLDVKKINDLDLQQVVYDWEVANNVRESSENYSWESIDALLKTYSLPNAVLAVTILEKIEIEPFLKALIGYYYDNNTLHEVKKLFRDKLFIRRPDLHQTLPSPGRAFYYSYNTFMDEYADKLNILD